MYLVDVRKENKRFVGDEILNWNFFNSEDQTAVRDVLFNDCASIFVFVIFKNSFLRRLHLNF